MWIFRSLIIIHVFYVIVTQPLCWYGIFTTTKIELIINKLKIFIINVEAFSTKKGVTFTEKFVLSHKPLFAVDESTTIKNPKAARTKAIIKISKDAAFRRI